MGLPKYRYEDGTFSNERQLILCKKPNGEFYWEEVPPVEERVIGHLEKETNPGLLEAIRTGKITGEFKAKEGKELLEFIKKANSKKGSD